MELKKNTLSDVSCVGWYDGFFSAGSVESWTASKFESNRSPLCKGNSPFDSIKTLNPNTKNTDKPQVIFAVYWRTMYCKMVHFVLSESYFCDTLCVAVVKFGKRVLKSKQVKLLFYYLRFICPQPDWILFKNPQVWLARQIYLVFMNIYTFFTENGTVWFHWL